jgi:hypothetical protein
MALGLTARRQALGLRLTGKPLGAGLIRNLFVAFDRSSLLYGRDEVGDLSEAAIGIAVVLLGKEFAHPPVTFVIVYAVDLQEIIVSMVGHGKQVEAANHFRRHGQSPPAISGNHWRSSAVGRSQMRRISLIIMQPSA